MPPNTFAPVRVSMIESLHRSYYRSRLLSGGGDHVSAKLWAKLITARRRDMPLTNEAILSLAYAVDSWMNTLDVMRGNRQRVAAGLIRVYEKYTEGS